MVDLFDIGSLGPLLRVWSHAFRAWAAELKLERLSEILNSTPRQKYVFFLCRSKSMTWTVEGWKLEGFSPSISSCSFGKDWTYSQLVPLHLFSWPTFRTVFFVPDLIDHWKKWRIQFYPRNKGGPWKCVVWSLKGLFSCNISFFSKILWSFC